MTAADRIDRQLAKLLVVNGAGAISHLPRVALASLFQPGDLVVANDAATLPASLERGASLERRTHRGKARRLGLFS
jgi:S-adenosylmethionine:tRNA ribosyltransferase-isomerase